MCCPKKLLETNPHLMYGCHIVPFANCKHKITRTVNYHVGNVDGLVLRVQCSGDVFELEKFFDGVKYGCNWLLSILSCIIDNFLALEELVRHQLPIVVL